MIGKKSDQVVDALSHLVDICPELVGEALKKTSFSETNFKRVLNKERDLEFYELQSFLNFLDLDYDDFLSQNISDLNKRNEGLSEFILEKYSKGAKGYLKNLAPVLLFIENEF